MLYIGCPMWGYKDWVGRGKLFPVRTAASEFLRIYSRKLTSVEGNTVFYALPSQETVMRWRQETPETFRFCPKVSRSISHAPRLDEYREETQQFVERMRLLGTRLGPVFLQLPPQFGPERLPELQAFLEDWPTDVRLAVEVRHAGFFAEPHAAALDGMLAQHHMARVVMDTRPIRTGTPQEQEVLSARERKPHLPVHSVTTTDFTFVRYIGHPEPEVNAPLLAEWAQQIGQWVKQGVTCYAFCHCPFEVHSPDICVELYRLAREQAPLPALPWGQEEEPPQWEQGRLF